MQTVFSFLAWIAVAVGSINQPSAASPGPTASSALASPVTVTLPVSDFGRIVVDGGSGHVFVSSPGSGEIVVLDFDGNVVSQISAEAGADGMVVKGTTLYVTLQTAGAIDAIDTKTLTRVKTVARGLIHPSDLVMAGGQLWTTSGNCGSWSVHLVGVDPTTGVSTAYPASGNLNYCAAFAPVNPTRPNLILGWSLGLSPATVTTLDVSTGRPAVVNTIREELLQNLQDVAITPDGRSWIAASGAPYNFPEFALSTLRQDGVVYPATNYPAAVAVSGVDGGVMAGGLDNQYAVNLYEYPIGAPGKAAYTNTNNREVASRGLAFSPDGTRIFEVTWNHDTAVSLTVLPAAASY